MWSQAIHSVLVNGTLFVFVLEAVILADVGFRVSISMGSAFLVPSDWNLTTNSEPQALNL